MRLSVPYNSYQTQKVTFFATGDRTRTYDLHHVKVLLYQLSYLRFTEIQNFPKWAGMDSNHRKQTLADLQSAPFDRSGTYPLRAGGHRILPQRGAHYTRKKATRQVFFFRPNAFERRQSAEKTLLLTDITVYTHQES